MNYPDWIEIRRHTETAPWRYADLDQRQLQIHSDLLNRSGSTGRLLLSEVAPVITTGKRPCPGDVLLPEALLAEKGISVYETDRGGRATYHGPGQWVLFAVERLETLTGDRRGVRQAVGGLLQIALEVGRSYDPRAEIREGTETGVWLPEGKFAAVGVKIKEGILLHGLSVNGFRTPTSFQGLKPCGLELPVSFLLGSEAGFQELGERLVGATLEKFWKKT